MPIAPRAVRRFRDTSVRPGGASAAARAQQQVEKQVTFEAEDTRCGGVRIYERQEVDHLAAVVGPGHYGRGVRADRGRVRVVHPNVWELHQIFQPADAVWRGIGTIPASGLQIRQGFAAFDAKKVFSLDISDVEDPKGCACGEILTGVKTPPDCALYKKVCSPQAPVGPCMVSSEGTCAAYYRYHTE